MYRVMNGMAGFALGAGTGLVAALLVVGVIAAYGGLLVQAGATPSVNKGGVAQTQAPEGAGASQPPTPPSAATRLAGASSLATLAGDSPGALAWAVLPLLLAVTLGVGAYLYYSKWLG